jgi:hypothetical protein
MQSTDLKEIKAALWGQAFGMGAWVGRPMGQVVAIRRRKSQIQAMVRGWGIRWYPVERVIIEDWLTKPAMQKPRVPEPFATPDAEEQTR